MDITTPAILFPAISLLFLSYTNKFLSLASLIRQLNSNNSPEIKIKNQISNLKKRLSLLKYMQLFGIFSFISCLGCMLLIHINLKSFGIMIFGISMVLLTISLLFAFWEIMISTVSINLELDKMK